MNKPIKPNITIPGSFALNGVKTDFDDEKLANGFDNLQPDVLAGDNLNKFIDDTYKGLNYGMAAADAINLINEGETLTVKDGKLSSGSVGDDYVKKTGDTMTGDLTISKSGVSDFTLINKNVDYTSTTNAETRIGGVFMGDKNSKKTGGFQNFVDSNNNIVSNIYARNNTTGTEKNCTISCYVGPTGSTWTSAPTPATGDNSTKIATTAFVNTVLPVGTIVSSGSSSTPTGYLYCNGSAVSRTTYAKLFSAIGTTYGAGDGSTTFNLPNYSNYNFVTSATVSVKGTGMTLGLQGGTSKNLYGGISGRSNDGIIIGYQEFYGKSLGTNLSSGTRINDKSGHISLGLTTDSSKSGITGSVSTATLKWYIKY